MAQIIDVTQIVDRQSVSRFLLGVIFLCTLVTLADGYNISVIAFAAPGMSKRGISIVPRSARSSAPVSSPASSALSCSGHSVTG